MDSLDNRKYVIGRPFSYKSCKKSKGKKKKEKFCLRVCDAV
jgi:hypothetical protein